MSRLKRILKWSAIAFGLLIAIALITNGILAWRSERRLQNMISELRAAGQPTSLAELAPKPIPPEENAAVFIERICAQLGATGERGNKFEREYADFYETPFGKSWEEMSEQGQLPTAEQAAAMRAILDHYPDVPSLIEQAAACDRYASILDYNLPPGKFVEVAIDNQVGHLRTVARYANWKMLVLIIDEGKLDEAVRVGTQMLHLARLQDEPCLVHYLVSAVVRRTMAEALNAALRKGSIDTAVRRELDAELAEQDKQHPLERTFRSERAFDISHAMEQISEIPSFVRWPARNFMLDELDVVSEAYNRSMRYTMDTWWDESPLLATNSPLAASILPTFDTEVSRIMLNRCLRILNALGAYRDRTGKEAESLDDLDLPAEAIVDPYSGKPLKLKWTDEGWVVYSAWRNHVDNGGRFNYSDGDWGLAPAGYPREE